MSDYLDHLDDIAGEDAAGLKEAQRSYGDSWRQRGGVGAFMMLARKWDRIEQRARQRPNLADSDRWDIFVHVAADARSEGIIDDIRDLRRYLMLVEAHCRAQGMAAAKSQHRDNVGDD